MARLKPPASEVDLHAAEQALGVALPADLAAWWRAADGAADHVWLLPGTFTPHSVRGALLSRQTWLEVSAQIEDEDAPQIAGEQAGTACYGAWLPLWLPIAYNGSGDELFVDLRSGPAFGCVGEFGHEEWLYDEPRWPSVTVLLAEVADALTNSEPIGYWTPRAIEGRLDWDLSVSPRPRDPRDGVPVGAATPQEIGLRPAVRADTGNLPTYVPRDIDPRLRSLLAESVERGRFVLVVGEPLAGKTRTLFEAVRAVFPHWTLMPASDHQLLVTSTRSGHACRVAWLDDMRAHRFSRHFLVDSIKRLRGREGILVGTCSLEQYEALIPPALANQPYVTREAPPGVLVGRSPQEWEALEVAEFAALTTVVHLPVELSPAEHAAAVTAGRDDEPIRAALADPGGLVPALAGGPDLVRRWERPQDPYDWSVVTAAADARRAGCRHALSRDLLTAMAPAYLDGPAPAEPPATIDALTETASGYVIGDYLYDHIRRARAATPLPDAAWPALVDHHHPFDMLTVADAAIAADRPEHAETIYRRLLDNAATATTDEPENLEIRGRAMTALDPLLTLLADTGRINDAIAALDSYADLDRGTATHLLDHLLAQHDRVDELQRRADNGDPIAATLLHSVLARTGDLDRLRQRVVLGDPGALHTLVFSLTGQGQGDQAIALLQARLDAGDDSAGALLAIVLHQLERADEAIALLQDLAARGDTTAAEMLDQMR